MQLFFDPRYALAKHGFDTTQKPRWIADSLQERPIPNVRLMAPPLLDEKLLTAVHDLPYIVSVRTGQPRELAESSGLMWDERTWDAALTTNGGMVAAALAVLKGCYGDTAGTLSSGLHHAKRAKGDGFCTFNGLALAAHAALRDPFVNRVLIIDLDAHCGGGTAELVARYGARVRHLDISVDPYDRYEPGTRGTLDIVTRASDYLPLLRSRLAELPSRFSLCLYNAGVDPHEDCTEGGLRGITREILDERDRIVFTWARKNCLPIAFTLAGGYVSPSLSQEQLIELHRATIQAAAVDHFGPAF